MQSGRVAPVDNSRKEERKREKVKEEKKKEKRSPLTMGSRDFGPLTS